MNIFKKIKNITINNKYLPITVLSVVFIILLLLFTKGDKGNPIAYQKTLLSDLKIEGPFELSNTTARYTLTQAIVDNHTFFLTPVQAKFSAPDVVSYKGKFISIFTPGVSLIGIPLYVLGEAVGLSQLLTFLTIAIIAFLNIFLIAKIARKMGAGFYAAILSGFIFVFMTNALGYTMTFTQHQLSTMLLLLAILNSLEQKRTWANNLLFGIIFSAGLLADIPNAVLMAPLGLYILIKNIHASKDGETVKVSIKTAILGLAIGLIPLTGLFAYYNYSTTGSLTKIAQNIGRTSLFRTNLPVQNPAESSPNPIGGSIAKPIINTPFNTRDLLNGLYILGLSNERSWLYYSPILFIGLFGLILLYLKDKEKRQFLNAIFAVIILNYLLYAMFDDPWGGWSFGARYLIPSAAVAATGIGFAIEKYKKKLFFVAIFFVLLIYSGFVSTLGTITTNAVAPKGAAESLKPAIPYTYEYNLDFVRKNESGNLLYNTKLKNVISLSDYWYILSAIPLLTAGLLFLLTLRKENGNE